MDSHLAACAAAAAAYNKATTTAAAAAADAREGDVMAEGAPKKTHLPGVPSWCVGAYPGDTCQHPWAGNLLVVHPILKHTHQTHTSNTYIKDAQLCTQRRCTCSTHRALTQMNIFCVCCGAVTVRGSPYHGSTAPCSLHGLLRASATATVPLHPRQATFPLRDRSNDRFVPSFGDFFPSRPPLPSPPSNLILLFTTHLCCPRHNTYSLSPHTTTHVQVQSSSDPKHSAASCSAPSRPQALSTRRSSNAQC